MEALECRTSAELLDEVLNRLGSERMLPRPALSLQKSRVNKDSVATHDGRLKKKVAATVRGAEALLDWSVRRGGFLYSRE